MREGAEVEVMGDFKDRLPVGVEGLADGGCDVIRTELVGEFRLGVHATNISNHNTITENSTLRIILPQSQCRWSGTFKVSRNYPTKKIVPQ